MFCKWCRLTVFFNKRIDSGINLSPANENLLIMMFALFMFFILKKIFRPGIFDKGALMPKEDKIPFASCFFINLVFLFPHTERLILTLTFHFFILIALASLFSVFFYSLHNKSACLFFTIMDVKEVINRGKPSVM